MSDSGVPKQEQEQSMVEARVDHVVGDRLCDACGFNLFGQAIVRERHYGMFIVRCPECGRVTSMQESPRAGRWSGRMTALLAGLWILCLFGALAGTVSALLGFSTASATIGSDNFESAIRLEHQDWQVQVRGVDPNTFQQQFGWNRIDTEWLDQTDLEAVLERAGGFRSVAAQLVWVWTPQMIVLFIIGVFWSTALMHSSRLRIALLGLAPVIITASLLLLVHRSMQAHALSGSWASGIATAHVAARTMACTLLLGATMLMLGIWLGRPFARMMVVFLLAPRLRAPLARLWLCDGKDFPVPKRRPIAATPAPAAKKKGPALKSAGPEDS